MKFLFTTFIVSFFIILSAQEELIYKIPKDAPMVIHAKGSKFLEQISLDEFNKTRMGNMLLNDLFSENKEEKDIKNLGVDFSSDMFFYQQYSDSIKYSCYLIPLNNSSKFEQLVSAKVDEDKNIHFNNGAKEFYESGKYMIWDTKKLLLIYGKLDDVHLREDSILAERYGLSDKSYYDFYYPEDSIVLKKYDFNSRYLSDSADVAPPAYDPSYDEFNDHDYPAAVDTIAIDSAYYENWEEANKVSAVSSDEYDSYEEREYYDEEAYDKYQISQDSIKNEMLKNWMYSYGESIFRRTKAQPSIKQNEDFLKTMDKNAAITYYVDISKSLPIMDVTISSFYSPYYLLNFFNGRFAKIFSGALNINKNNMQFKYNLELYNEDIEDYKQLYNHKLNKNFYQYINSDQDVGYISSVINTRKFLEMFPQWVAKMYGKDDDEIELFLEIATLCLDQKAISEVIKGDVLFLFKGVTAKEYTYKTYEYDDDYNSTEVEKTKMSNVPEFLLMASSDNPRIFYSLLNYGIKKENVELEDGIYHIHSEEFEPISIYMLIKEKEGIVFIGSTKDDLIKIKTNTYKGNINKMDKKNLSSNIHTINFKPNRLINKMPKSSFDNLHFYMRLMNLLGSMGEINGKDEGVKRNSIVGEYIFETTNEDENSIKYFLKLSEMLTDM